MISTVCFFYFRAIRIHAEFYNDVTFPAILWMAKNARSRRIPFAMGLNTMTFIKTMKYSSKYVLVLEILELFSDFVCVFVRDRRASMCDYFYS